ncbi:hypothetical protein AJ78_08400 [Emergomyces pasteurianus Ep9510]|uniref:Zn(2)-C6 fungal-type domain-containing protein n=1 Tax=Emergomyces pasteurianus Ep9510 TaxID=1447872 RepID=A0A1J9P449_9EURO|nr:hypothetical protein AJ78_08400 [Emergomyces pasteurianus Ep9510]
MASNEPNWGTYCEDAAGLSLYPMESVGDEFFLEEHNFPLATEPSPAGTEKTQKRKLPKENDNETIQTSPSKRIRTEADMTGNTSYEHNKYNVRQEAETRVKRDAIDNHALGTNEARRKNAPRTLEACNRCKARKMKCSTDPIQCTPCRHANETCYHAHPITGKAYKRAWPINEYATKLRELEQQSEEIAKLRELVKLLEDRLIEVYQDSDTQQERAKRIEELNKLPSIERAEEEKKKKEMEEFDKLVLKEMSSEKQKLDTAKARKAAKAGAGEEANDATQGKTKTDEDKPIAKDTVQDPIQPQQRAYAEDDSLHTDAGLKQPLQPEKREVPGPAHQFPSSNRGDSAANPSFTTPRPTRQPQPQSKQRKQATQPKQPKQPKHRARQPEHLPPGQQSHFPEPQPLAEPQPPPQRPSERDAQSPNLFQYNEAQTPYSSRDDSVERVKPFDDVADDLP